MQCLFLGYVPVYLVSSTSQAVRRTAYDVCLNTAVAPVTAQQLRGDVLARATPDAVYGLLVLAKRNLRRLRSLTLLVDDYPAVVQAIQSSMTLIKAAGGIVGKSGSVLLMDHKVHGWGLPKGKLDPGEGYAEAAMREVEEECGVQVALERDEPVCTSWYSYVYHGQWMLKQVVWYAMKCVDDSRMRPQQTEGIEQVAWVGYGELAQKLKKAYSSVRYVLGQYFRVLGVPVKLFGSRLR